MFGEARDQIGAPALAALELQPTTAQGDAVDVIDMASKTASKINSVAKALGVRVRFVDSVRGGSANAQYQGSDILVEKNNPNPVLWLLGHEWIHRLQEIAPTQYRAFRDAVAPGLQEEVNRLLDHYRANGENITVEQAMDEAAANQAGRMIENTDILDNFIKNHKENRTLLEKVRDAIRHIAEKLTGAEKRKAKTAEELLTAALDAGEKAAKSLQEGTARGTMNETKSSLKEDQASRNFAWALDENLLDKREQAAFWSGISDIRDGRYVPRSRSGSYIVDIGSKLIFTDGDVSAPSITRIIEFNDDSETYMSEYKELIFDEERRTGQSAESLRAIEVQEGEWYVSQRVSPADSPHGRQAGRGEGENRSRNPEKAESGAQFSLKEDTRGRSLSPQQAEFFRDSKAAESLQESTDGAKMNEAKNSLKDKWHTDLTKAEMKQVQEFMKRDITRSTNSFTGTSNWLLTRVNSQDVFGIYSTEVPDNPTLLYEAKGERGLFERDALLDLMEGDYYGESSDGKASLIERWADRLRMQRPGEGLNRAGVLGAGSDGGNDAVHGRAPRRHPSAAFENVVRNLLQNEKQSAGDGVTFSLKGSEDMDTDREALLRKQVEGLQERLAYWKRQTKRTTTPTIDSKAVRRFAKELTQDYKGIRYSDIEGELQALYDYIIQNRGGDETELWLNAVDRASSIAQTIVDHAVTESDYYQEYSDLRNYLRTTQLVLGPEYHGDIPDFNDFRKRHLGRLDIRTGHTNIDQVYHEMSEMWPGLFNEESEIHPADQLLHIAEVIDSLYAAKEESAFYGYEREAVDGIAAEIIEGFFGLPETKETFADRQYAKLQDAKAQGKEAVRQQRLTDDMYYGRKIAELRRKSRERTEAAIQKEKSRMERRIQALKDHYAEVKQRQAGRRADSKDRTKLLNIIRRLQNAKLPANAGQPWTKEEEQCLLDGHRAGQSVGELAKSHGRTRGAIESRLAQLGEVGQRT